MSKQAQNFKELVKGNPVSNIITALNMVSSAVRSELMKEYNVNSVDALAIKLA